MRVLVDTHALLWAVTGDRRLSKRAHSVLASFANEVFVSAASAWEITTKHRLGKLPAARSEEHTSELQSLPLPDALPICFQRGRPLFSRPLPTKCSSPPLPLGKPPRSPVLGSFPP